MLDCVDRVVGLDPLELRRRNVLHEDDLPYTTTLGIQYDQMTPAQTLEQAATLLGYNDLRPRRRRSSTATWRPTRRRTPAATRGWARAARSARRPP
jgi:carbon-monoxide dehydrogenase large subunit